MDVFITTTADEHPVTIAIDDTLYLALVVVGGDENAWSGSMDIVAAFNFKAEVGLFDIDEAWCLLTVLRDNPFLSAQALRSAAIDLLES